MTLFWFFRPEQEFGHDNSGSFRPEMEFENSYPVLANHNRNSGSDHNLRSTVRSADHNLHSQIKRLKGHQLDKQIKK